MSVRPRNLDARFRRMLGGVERFYHRFVTRKPGDIQSFPNPSNPFMSAFNVRGGNGARFDPGRNAIVFDLAVAAASECQIAPGGRIGGRQTDFQMNEPTAHTIVEFSITPNGDVG
jgi:hypothetical protein